VSTTHPQNYWFAGDDWQINATLLDSSGAPFNLAGTPDIRWALVNEDGETVLDQFDVQISVMSASLGQCAIIVPAEKTFDLTEGKYSDVLRIVYGGVTSTLMHGNNWVTADPFTVPVPDVGINARIVATEARDAAVITADAAVAIVLGTMAAIEVRDAAAISGNAAVTVVTVALAATEAKDTAAISAVSSGSTTGNILLSDGTSALLQTDATSKVKKET
jgi:hypothetical protein